MTELKRKQILFTRLLSKLLNYIHESGYEVTVGDAYRNPNVNFGYGKPNSLHKVRLAIDLNLFDKNDNFLKNTKDHEPFGKYWESLSDEAVWGGRFDDGNHYSVKYEGMK